MQNLKGKRLLFLGGIRILCEAVEYAKEMGIYTIVTDYLADSPAKKIADKSYMISTTDTDALVEMCKKERVDGVFVAFIDSMLPYAKKLCDRLNLPFYATEQQIKMSLDKRFFKEICRKYEIPVPTDYTYNSETDSFDKEVEFPVIVKPVDSSGGRGIKICNNLEDLKKAYDYAMSVSPSKTVLVEEYIVGDEVTATYTMSAGEISMSAMKDKLVSQDHENITSQSDVLIFPSNYLNQYMEKVNQKVIDMLKGISAMDGTVFFQGIANKNKIAFFECGYRPNGACDYRHIEKMNNVNFLKMMIAYAITGKMGNGDELEYDTPFFGSYILNFNLWGHHGRIGSLSGLEQVLQLENVSFAEYMHDVGETLVDNNTLSQRVFRAIIMDKKIERIKETIKKIQGLIQVVNEKGENMLYSPFDISRLDRYGE